VSITCNLISGNALPGLQAFLSAAIRQVLT
jgi:hypothetical protein